MLCLVLSSELAIRGTAIAKSYKQAIALVVQETPLSKQDLPKECPYTLEQIIDPQFPFDPIEE